MRTVVLQPSLVPVDRSPPSALRAWGLLGVLITGYVGVYLCRKNLSVVVPLLQTEFHANKEQVGRISSVGTLTYAVGKVVLGPLIDRVGGRLCYLLSLAGVAIFGAVGAFVPSLGLLGAAYSANRFCGAGAWGSMVKQTPPWFNSRTLPLALAVLSLSYVFGGAVALAFAGEVAALSQQQWPLILGVPSFVVVALLILCALVLPKNEQNKTRETEAGFSRAQFFDLIRFRPFLVVCALSFTLTLVREIFNDWAVDFIKQQGGVALSVRAAAFLSTPFDLCGAAGILLLGTVYRTLSPLRRRQVLGALLATLGVVLAVLPHLLTLPLSVVASALGLIGFLALGPYSLLAGYFAVQLRGPRFAGTIAGIIDCVGYLAGIFAGSAFGWVLDRGGYSLGFNLLAGLSFIAAVLALALNPHFQSDHCPHAP